MIKEFQDEYRFLSNMYPAKIQFMGIVFKTSEHLYQAHKAIYKTDFENIVNCSTGVDTKKYANKMKKDNRIRSDFHNIKNSVMTLAVTFKFGQNKDLLDKLINTGKKQLIEGNYWHDNYWGDCTCDKCKHITGWNMLGKILMDVRTILTFKTQLME